MVSPKLNFFVNLFGGLNFAACALTGIFMKSRTLPLNLEKIHPILGWLLIFFVIAHIILHFQWIKNIPKFFAKNEKNKN